MKRLISQLDQTLPSTAEQVLNLILFMKVNCSLVPVVLESSALAVQATIRLVSDSASLQILFLIHRPRSDAVRTAVRMLQMSEDAVAIADSISDVMGEVVNVLGGGLKTATEEQISDFVPEFPEVQEKPAGELPPLPAPASVRHFSNGEDLQFSIALIKEGACARTR